MASQGSVAREEAGVPPAAPGPSDAARPGAVGPTLEGLMQSYGKWSKRTPEPISISSSIWALCRLPSRAEQAFVESEHGDGLYLLDWVNDEAAQRLNAGGAVAFPSSSESISGNARA